MLICEMRWREQQAGLALLEPRGHQGAGAWEEGAHLYTVGVTQAVTCHWPWASPVTGGKGWGAAVMGELRRVTDSAMGRLLFLWRQD